MNWIVFDYGDVISEHTDALPTLAKAFGVEVAEFEPHYWAERIRYDSGGTDLEYWQSLGRAFGVEVDRAFSDELTRTDVTGWSHVEPAVLELLEGLHEAGAALALLSNASSTFGRWVREQDWARLFRVTLFSGDVGCMKPDAKIYRILLGELGAEPADCLFFDDRQSNVDGARAVGMKAERWVGVTTVKYAFGSSEE
ncbi:HAD family hydrolase [Amycolatopsis regifaucium]|uniref:HAD family hydrolase n=1 Tax=Amycolatopsis regifaucium TaxID=546365 RepID=A0A154MMQ7_9PSEU|nr:HAD family phosphatase [Amycolatopsis regifaucium]KZB85137.1 HAD family hydrolase [Amycolatopsis regifaucium]OKA04161.1 HAD family hydrolase [Amycolatopsis regifaucium]SFH92702.1 putative hydrolase of the HAD superfamily [Amycolatopsis regifaucium]